MNLKLSLNSCLTLFLRLLFRSLWSLRFFMFLKIVSYADHSWIFIKNTLKLVMLSNNCFLFEYIKAAQLFFNTDSKKNCF